MKRIRTIIPLFIALFLSCNLLAQSDSIAIDTIMAMDTVDVDTQLVIPDPEVAFGAGYAGGDIALHQLLRDSALVVIQDHPHSEYYYQVVSFEMIYKGRYDVWHDRTIGNSLSYGMREILKNADIGTVTFMNIQLKGGMNNKYRLMPPLEFNVY